LEHYQNYVPSLTCEKDITDIEFVEDKHFLKTLVGGDYLSVMGERGAHVI